MSFLNTLQIPKTFYGETGINTGNIISEKLQSGKIKYSVQWDVAKHQVIVLNSSDLEIDVLNKILYDDDACTAYKGWYPKVEEKRDETGNLLIELSCFHSHRSKETRENLSKNDEGDFDEELYARLLLPPF